MFKKYLSSTKQEKSSFQVGSRVKADQISVLKKTAKIMKNNPGEQSKKRPFTSKAQARLTVSSAVSTRVFINMANGNDQSSPNRKRPITGRYKRDDKIIPIYRQSKTTVSLA
ncbi:hypothetical protein ACFFRR_007812 [Megaselia abdita]